MAGPTIYPMSRRRFPIRGKLHHARISSVSPHRSEEYILKCRFLVDTDREVEGLRVIADFQGKPLDHEDVLLEYKEIRDAVLLDVSY
jgi:hypothetical protein